MSRVSVVIVSWNSAEHLEAAVRSVPAGVPVVVVDNASADGSAEVAGRAGATVLRQSRNLGFGPACNAGAAQGPASELVLFLNPDAALIDGEACLATLVAELDADPGVAAVAPALVGAGQELFQLRRLPGIASLSREAFLVNRLWPRNPWLLEERYAAGARDGPFDVDQPAGAALLIRRSDFDALGGFDPDFTPAWFEDVDLCARLREGGRRIRYVPAARAAHRGGSSLARLAYRDFVPLYTRNLLRYVKKHGDASMRLLSRPVLAAGALLRLALLPATTGDHPRGETAVAYARVLRGLLGLGWNA